MKKFTAVILISAAVALSGTGCSKPANSSEIKSFISTEMSAADKCYDILRSNISEWDTYDSDKKIAENIKSVTLPQTETALSVLNQAKFKDDDASKLQTLYIEAFDQYKEGQEMLLEAISKKDSSIREEAYTVLDKARQSHDKYSDELEKVLAKTGFDIKY